MNWSVLLMTGGGGDCAFLCVCVSAGEEGIRTRQLMVEKGICLILVKLRGRGQGGDEGRGGGVDRWEGPWAGGRRGGKGGGEGRGGGVDR
jgi:hypothetical protein